jgi:hypothetical protein
MEKFDSRKAVPEIHVDIFGVAERREILKKLSNVVPVMFVLTKGYDLHLGSEGHENIRFGQNIEWENELAVGVVRLENENVSIKTYDKISEGLEFAIRGAVANFLANSSTSSGGEG